MNIKTIEFDSTMLQIFLHPFNKYFALTTSSLFALFLNIFIPIENKYLVNKQLTVIFSKRNIN